MFGYGGAIVSVMIVGFVVGALSVMFVKLEKNPITVGLYAYFTIQLPNMIQGGFADFIYSPNMMFIAVTAIVIIIFGFVLKRTNRKGNGIT
jgi:hypothetical protein